MMAVVILSCGVLSADGVFAYKTQKFHDDKDAKLTLYSQLDSYGAVTWITSGGKRFSFDASQPHEWIELPTTLPWNLILVHEITSINQKILEILKFVEKYPKSAKSCENSLRLHVEAAEKLKAGEIIYQGDWMSRRSYDEQIAKRIREDQMAQAAVVKAREDRIRLEEEKVKLEESMRAKELAAKEALRFSRVQAVETEIQSIEAENTSLKSEIRDRFSDISKIIIDNHL